MARPALRPISLLTILVLLLSVAWERTAGQGETTEQALWSPYWTVQPGFTSTLEVKNNRAQETLTVIASLYFTSGEEHYLEPIQLAPRQTAIVNLNRVLESLSPFVAARASKEGTAEVKFNGPNLQALMGSISVTNPERGIAWNFRLYPVIPLPAAPIRGLFWFHDERTDGFVALQNASEEFISVTPRFDIAGATYPLAPLSLAPGQGFKLELRRELQKLGLSDVTAGGIEFTYQGPPDALKAHGVLFNNHGFSAEVDFNRYDTWTEPRKVTLRTPRFAVGKADPALGLPAATTFDSILALHNFNRHELPVTVSVGYRSGGAAQELQIPLSLAAGAARVLSLHPYLAGMLPDDARWASLELSYTDRHNGLAAALVSVSQDGTHSIRSVLNWLEGSGSEGWLWRADADYNTLIGMLNSDAEEAQVAVSLHYYANGLPRSYELPERTIPARNSDLVDVGQIIASGAPDADGDTIPPGVTFGGYTVQKTGPRFGNPLITEALVFNRRTKTFLTLYNTTCCCDQLFVRPGQFIEPVGFNGQVVAICCNSCNGACVEIVVGLSFFSSNPAVAPVDSSGLVTGVAPGTATITTTAGVEFFHFPGPNDPLCQVDLPCATCQRVEESRDTPVTVQPTVEISGPDNVPLRAVGSTGPNSITLTATGSPTGGSFNWTSSSTKVTLTNASSASVTVTSAAESTAIGDVPISVTYTVNQQSGEATKNITVAKATSLFVESDTTDPTGTPCNVTCLNGSPGCSYNSYLRTRIYVVQDQFSRLFTSIGISSVDVRESYSGVTSTCGASPPVTAVSLTSRFDDKFSFCSSACLPGGPGCTNSATQTLTVNGFSVRTVSVTWTCTGVSLSP